MFPPFRGLTFSFGRGGYDGGTCLDQAPRDGAGWLAGCVFRLPGQGVPAFPQKAVQEAALDRPRNRRRSYPAMSGTLPVTSPQRATSPSEVTLAVVLVIAAMAFSWARSAETPAVDFFTKWTVARAVQETGGKDAYSAVERQRIGAALSREFASPATMMRQRMATAAVLSANRGEMEAAASPFLYASMALFGLEDYETSYLLFALVSLLSLVAAIVLLGRHLVVPLTWTLVLLAIVAAHFEPLRSDVRVGNINQLHLAAVVVASLLVSPGRRGFASVGAGFLLGIAAAAKPNVLLAPAFLLVGLWLDGRRRNALAFLVGLLGGSAAAFLAAAAFFGDGGVWLAWRKVLPSLLGARYGIGDGNFGLSALVYELTGVDASIVILLLLLLLLALALWRSQRNVAEPAAETGGGRDGLLLAGLGCGFMILSGPYVWIHYFVLALPLCAIVLFRPDRGAARVAGFVAGGVLLISTAVLDVVAPRAYAVQAILLDLSVLVLVGLGLRALSKSSPPATALVRS